MTDNLMTDEQIADYERLKREEYERLAAEEQERLMREEQERLMREEQERLEAEEQAREQARLEHEQFLDSFPETTVFYDAILSDGDAQWLGQYVRDPHVADRYGWIKNHIDESELTKVETRYYLKGHEKPEPSEAEIISRKIDEIDKALEDLMDSTVHQKNYKNIESCVSYYNSDDDEFRADARAALRWRDDIYSTARYVRDKVLAGELDYRVVTVDYIMSMVTPLEW